ncbi:hypothetical protein HN51_026318 [Arachis hypogaea]|nr:receptor-like protein EIX2 [Arachis hypogaea]
MGVRYHTIIGACAFLLVVAELAHLCSCANSSLHLHSPCVERERQALVKFKESLIDPSNLLFSWQGVHCCQWKGIGCDNVTGHVVKLDLTTSFERCQRSQPFGDQYNFWDTYEIMDDTCKHSYYDSVEALNVNPSLLELEYLTHLDLGGNFFRHNPIPMFIGSMQQLRYLSLSNAGFGGRIPKNLGNLTNLHFLDLSGNEFCHLWTSICFLNCHY